MRGNRWHSSLEIEQVARQAHYTGSTGCRRARTMAEKGEIHVKHVMTPVTHNGKTKKTKIAYYKI